MKQITTNLFSWTKLICFCSIILALGSCKKNDWLDWKTQNQLWLEQNKRAEGVQVTPTGLQYKIISDPNPTDARPTTGSTVYCDYKGRLINGVQFDGGTASLQLNKLVPGFAEGLKHIHCHGDIELYIPYQLGYADKEKGTEGTQSYIPPYSTLIFSVHLRAVK